MRNLLLVVVLLGVAGCSRQAMVDSFAPRTDRKAAVDAIHLLRTHQYDALEKKLDPSIREPGNIDTLRRMAQTFPAAPPVSSKLVGAYINTMTGPGDHKSSVSTSNLTFEYEFPGDTWVLAGVQTRTDSTGRFITGFHVKAVKDSLEHINRFTLAGKAPLFYLVFALTLAVPLFILYALIRCIRTPLRGRKWPWVLFILFGLCGFTLNWTTGQWAFQLVRLELLGAGFMSAPYGPWMFTVSLPLGAIIFLLRRRSLVVEAAAQDGST